VVSKPFAGTFSNASDVKPLSIDAIRDAVRSIERRQHAALCRALSPPYASEFFWHYRPRLSFPPVQVIIAVNDETRAERIARYARMWLRGEVALEQAMTEVKR
jgi:hypothetical protein